MTASPTPHNRRPAPSDAEDRVVDPDADNSLPSHLDVGPEVPVPDVIDQRRAVVLDDETER